jgi:hypothetical protein
MALFHEPQQLTPLFDHLVGAAEQRQGHFDAERLQLPSRLGFCS